MQTEFRKNCSSTFPTFGASIKFDLKENEFFPVWTNWNLEKEQPTSFFRKLILELDARVLESGASVSNASDPRYDHTLIKLYKCNSQSHSSISPQLSHRVHKGVTRRCLHRKFRFWLLLEFQAFANSLYLVRKNADRIHLQTIQWIVFRHLKKKKKRMKFSGSFYFRCPFANLVEMDW